MPTGHGTVMPFPTPEHKMFVFLSGLSAINQNTDTDQGSGQVTFLGCAEDTTQRS